MSRINGTDSPADALAKIAHLTGLFERLVAEAGLLGRLIEQRLAELAEGHPDAPGLSPPHEPRAA